VCERRVDRCFTRRFFSLDVDCRTVDQDLRLRALVSIDATDDEKEEHDNQRDTSKSGGTHCVTSFAVNTGQRNVFWRSIVPDFKFGEHFQSIRAI
jgi:hypothetical protein